MLLFSVSAVYEIGFVSSQEAQAQNLNGWRYSQS